MSEMILTDFISTIKDYLHFLHGIYLEHSLLNPLFSSRIPGESLSVPFPRWLSPSSDIWASILSSLTCDWGCGEREALAGEHESALGLGPKNLSSDGEKMPRLWPIWFSLLVSIFKHLGGANADGDGKFLKSPRGLKALDPRERPGCRNWGCRWFKMCAGRPP